MKIRSMNDKSYFKGQLIMASVILGKQPDDFIAI